MNITSGLRSTLGNHMNIKVTGKNVEVSDAYTTFAGERVTGALDKYVGSDFAGHIRLEKERGRFRTSCSIRLRSGLLLEAQGGGADAYSSVDSAVEKLEKRVRRHKRRLKSHHHGGKIRQVVSESTGRDYIVELDDDAGDLPSGQDHPVVVAESEFRLPEFSVSEAVMQLDLIDGKFLVFRNAGTGSTNIVYRREDGNIGWIDPQSNGAARVGDSRV